MSQRADAVVISTIGIDTGKNTLHLVGLDDQGTVLVRRDTYVTYDPAVRLRKRPIF